MRGTLYSKSPAIFTKFDDSFALPSFNVQLKLVFIKLYLEEGKNFLPWLITWSIVACVASVSVWFRSKKRSKRGIFGKMEQEPKNETLSHTHLIFRAVFDSLSSFFDPKPHGNA